MKIVELRGLFAAYDAVLTDSAALAEALNVRAVRAAAGGRDDVLFGRSAEAFHHWVARRWSQLDPRHAIVNRFQREALLVRSQGVSPLERNPRWARLLARLVRTYSGTPQWEQTVRAGSLPEHLADGEREALSKLDTYYELLEIHGLIEFGDAALMVACALVDDERFCAGCRSIAYVSDEPPSPIVRAFVDLFAGSGGFTFNHLATDGSPWRESMPDPSPASPQVETCIIHTPRSPREQLVQAYRDIRIHAASGPVRVCSKDPTATYEALAPLLALDGGPARPDIQPIRASLRHGDRFDQGVFGRFLIAHQHVDWGTRKLDFGSPDEPRAIPWDKAALADALSFDRLAPSRNVLWSLDANWRERLLVTKDQALGMLYPIAPAHTGDGAEASSATSSGTSSFAMPFEIHAPRPIAEQTTESAEQKLWDASRREVLEARAFLESLGWEDGAEIDALLLSLWADGRTGGPITNLEDGLCQAPVVEFCDFTEGTEPSTDEPATLILLDLDADSFPVAVRGTALDGLVSKLGLPAEDSSDRQARLWRRLLAVPSQTLILSRPLRDESGNDLRPCEFLTDFIEATSCRDEVEEARIDGTSVVVSQSGIRQVIDPAASVDHLAGTIWPLSLDPLGQPLAGSSGTSDWPEDRWSQLFGGSTASDGESGEGGFEFRPADIQTYLECPCKWFWQSQLSTYELDHGFDAPARAKYLRDCIYAFTERCEQRGITSGEPQAQAAMREAMAEVQATYRESDGSGSPKDLQFSRYLAVPGTIEPLELNEVDGWLDSWPAFEASYLQGSGFTRRYNVKSYNDVRYLGKFRGAMDGAEFCLRPYRLDLYSSEQSFLITVLESSLRGISFVDPKELVDDREFPDVANLPISMVRYGVFLSMMGRNHDEPWGWNGELRGTRPAGIVVVSMRDDHPVKGFCDARSTFISETELGRRPGIVAVETGLFQRTLDAIERFVATEVIAPIRRGEIPCRPRLTSSCAYCGDCLCPMRRSHD